MIIENIMRLLFINAGEPAGDDAVGAEMDTLVSTMGCENYPVYIPADVWQRVSDLGQAGERM